VRNYQLKTAAAEESRRCLSRKPNLSAASTDILSWKNKIARAAWRIAWALLYRPTPRGLHAWRRTLLRLFGARIGRGVHPYPTARIWAPWNLEMGDGSCLGEHVECYCVGRVTIGAHSTVSQFSHLCAATRSFEVPGMPLIIAPITVGAHVWITTDVFVGPGVKIGDGAVIGARSSVFSDIDEWMVAYGSPARPIRQRNAKWIRCQN
jgi:putative colanic acid biosynthesis acetyltransferase WcaF